MGSSRERIFLTERTVPARRCFQSVFQPVFGLAYQRPVGYEALLRELDSAGSLCTPTEFGEHRRGATLATIDQKSHLVHLEEASRRLPDNHWLFLNISAATMLRPGYAAKLAARAQQRGLRPERVVLEILEDPDGAESSLAAGVESFRAAGFLIALDDFGAGYSNLARLLRLRPDIVKLDQSLLKTVGSDEPLLGHLVRLLHERGILVVAEGVETENELLAIVQADVDFAQGFFLGSPQIAPAVDPLAATRIDHAYDRLCGIVDVAGGAESFATALRMAVGDLIAGQPPQQYFARMLRMSGCIGCFVLDSRGRQIGPTLWGPDALSGGQRFAPMAEFNRGRWDNREYFRQALSHPGQVAQSQRSRSVNGAQICLTIAVAVQCPDGTRVIGGDFSL